MAQHPNDDLFEGTSMTFGEHLEELRQVLFRALIGLVISFGIGLACANWVVQFIQTPLTDALDNYYRDKAVATLLQKFGHANPEWINTIQKDGLVPTPTQFDPASLIGALETASPKEFKGAELKPYQFTPADITLYETPKFCKLLTTAGVSARDSKAGFVWKEMTASDQANIKRIAAKTEENATAAERKQVIAALNGVADKRKLNEAPAFASTTLAPDTAASAHYRTMLGEKFDADTSRRLNHHLIAEAFPQIRAPRAMLVEIVTWKKTDVRVQALGAHEAFMLWVKAGFVCGLIIASPWIFIQIWKFVAAGLYPHEQRYVYIYLPFSLALFIAGAALAFFFVFEPVLNFLFGFNRWMNIDPDPRISEWVGFVLTLPIGFGVAFQLPLVMLFINRIGLVTTSMYAEKWRIAILVIAVASMLLTPADPISMMLMAVPLTFLYFLGIGLCRWMPQGRNPFQFEEAYEP